MPEDRLQRSIDREVRRRFPPRATGQGTAFPDDLVEAELAFTRQTLPPDSEMPAGHRPFGTPEPVADDAPALDRLVALLGRTP